LFCIHHEYQPNYLPGVDTEEKASTEVHICPGGAEGERSHVSLQVLRRISRNDDGWLFYSRGNNQACALNVTYTMDNAFVYITVPSNNSRFLVPRNNWLRTKVHLCLGPALDKWKFEIIEPIIRRDIHDVVYQTSNTIPNLNPPHVTSLQPLVLLETIVSNASAAAENRQTSTYTYKKTESATWSDKIGITYGWNITFHANVPVLIGGLNSDYQISMSSTKEHRWGHTHEEAVEVSSSTEITVPEGDGGVQRRDSADI